MNIFQEVKERVTARHVAEKYLIVISVINGRRKVSCYRLLRKRVRKKIKKYCSNAREWSHPTLRRYSFVIFWE